MKFPKHHFLFSILFFTTLFISAQLECEEFSDEIISANYHQSAALLIGNSNYDNGWQGLEKVSSDIDAIASTLCNKGFIVKKYKDLEASRLDQVISEFIGSYGRETNNRLVFYIAGHGHTVQRSYGGNTDYFVGIDAPLASSNSKEFERKSLDLSRFNNYAESIDAKHVTFVFDACFAGNIFRHSIQSDQIEASAAKFTSNPIRFFITSGSEGEVVDTSSRFAEKFIEGITTTSADYNKDYLITGIELGYFLKNEISLYSGNAQTPLYGAIINDLLDDGEMFFSLMKLKPDLPDNVSFDEVLEGRKQQYKVISELLNAYVSNIDNVRKKYELFGYQIYENQSYLDQLQPIIDVYNANFRDISDNKNTYQLEFEEFWGKEQGRTLNEMFDNVLVDIHKNIVFERIYAFPKEILELNKRAKKEKYSKRRMEREKELLEVKLFSLIDSLKGELEKFTSKKDKFLASLQKEIE